MLVSRVRLCLRTWRSRVRLMPCSPRFMSTHSFPSPIPVKPLKAVPTAELRRDLDSHGPRIDIDASHVRIIESPTEFYSTLLSKISNARRRIYLSTLYIGSSEHELVEVIRSALVKNEFLQVSILTDALRGTRESPQASCASLLSPLVRDFGDRVEVRMYHTPNLTGLRKAIVPKRINEGWGLQHAKLYGFDDELMLSGANLSHDYFTNRQDRYHLFRSKQVADYFARIHSALCSVSFELSHSSEPGGHKLIWPASNRARHPLEAPLHYKAAVTSLLKPLISPPTIQFPPSESNTSIYPLLVHPPTINTELPAIKTLLDESRFVNKYTFTAGYFNPHPLVTDMLIRLSSPPNSTSGTILTASPKANGFFGSKGISGMLPAAYSRLSLLFLRAAAGKNIQIREWQRGTVGQADGWTYHAKGLWTTFQAQKQIYCGEQAEDSGPSVTLIGSSNYTARSYGLDLEVGALVVTTDEGLQRRWKQEEEMLKQYTKPITEKELSSKDRKASLKVRIAMWIVRKVGGAL